MGHADRPRRNNAIRLDAQSRGVRFPLVRRRGDANTNRYTNANSHSYSNSNGNYHSNANRYSHSNS